MHGAAISRAELAAAQRVRDSVQRTFEAMLADHPLLVMPTLTGRPPLLGERGFGLTVLTAPVNLAGLPALTLPVPVPANGHVAASLQVIGPAGSEEQLIAFGRVVEGMDVVVRMGREVDRPLPSEFNGRMVDWDIPDPFNCGVETFRTVRDTIARRVLALLAEVIPPEASS